LEDLLKMVRLTNAFQKIKRVILIKDEEAFENDAEHSFQLALTAWYIIENDHLDFNFQKVIGYAQVHDLVEIYAGDTFVYADAKHHASKAQRESEAAQRLAEEFPEFPSLSTMIEAYEGQVDPESRFVFALDKLLPVIIFIWIMAGFGYATA